MSPAARSIQAFGAYLMLVGATLVVVPNLLITPVGLPETREVWIRVLGVVVLAVATYYFVAARHELQPLVRATVPVRFGVAACFAVFVATGLVGWPLLIFGAIDIAAALWTWSALRA